MALHRIVIEPGTADRHYWRDLWTYRGLFWFLAWRDILVRYKQTVIGIAWSVLRPLLTLGAMALVGWLFNSHVPEGVPRLLLVAAATLPWTFFSTAFSEASNSLIANSNLLTKVYFPRLIVPASTLLVCLIDLLISFAILLVLLAVYRYVPDFRILFLPLFTLLAIVVVPTTIAALLGLGVFKRRVKGAYFAILSQALAAALAILLVGQATLGGSNGLNGFRTFFGFRLSDPVNRKMLYFIAAAVLLIVVAVVRQLMQSRYGELLVAVRDGEERVRFLGYDPANIKVVAYTAAALFAAIAGALFAPIIGFITPAQIGVVPSIAFLIGVAIGGRTTLLGPVLGAIGVAWAQTMFSERFPSGWTYAQGLMFIVVVGFFPAGLAGLGMLVKRRRRTAAPAVDRDPEPEKVGAAL